MHPSNTRPGFLRLIVLLGLIAPIGEHFLRRRRSINSRLYLCNRLLLALSISYAKHRGLTQPNPPPPEDRAGLHGSFYAAIFHARQPNSPVDHYFLRNLSAE